MNEKIKLFLEEIFSNHKLNRLPESYGDNRIFSSPLIGVASGEDDIFLKFKEIISPEYLNPVEIWKQNGFTEYKNLPLRLRIMSLVFPYVSKIREEGKFHIYSTWSERHTAFACGLGTFSLHEGLITEAGCNIRLASIITDAPLEITPRVDKDPYGNCLHYTDKACGKCINKCPTGAITEKGHDKEKCLLYRQQVREEMHKRSLKLILKPKIKIINGEKRISYPVGCALCQFGVPCTDKNPTYLKQEKG